MSDVPINDVPVLVPTGSPQDPCAALNQTRLRRGAALLQFVHALGVEVCPRWLPAEPPTPFCDGRPRRVLAVRDPTRVLSAEMRRELRDAQEDVLLCLFRGPVHLLTFREFNGCGRVVRVWSGVLGEEVLIAADNADRCHPLLRHPEGRIVYRASEIQHLSGDPDGLRRIHEIKKVFGEGTLVVGSEIVMGLEKGNDQ